MQRKIVLAVAMLCGLASVARAHVTLEQGQAAPGDHYKGVLQLGHGCDGAATTAVRIRLPEGVIAVRPMLKPGWEIETVLAGGEVREIVWSGGSVPDDRFDEFVFLSTLPEVPDGTVLYFPVIQECAEGVHRWIEIPEPGEDPDDLPEPAPGVTLTAPRDGH